MIGSIRNLESINGKPIIHMDDLRDKYPQHFNSESGQMDYKWFEKEIRPHYHIYVRHDVDSLTFNMLTKPASEGGDLNRCQATDIIGVAIAMISHLDEKFSCEENAKTLEHLNMALHWQDARTENRKSRGVEGKNEP